MAYWCVSAICPDTSHVCVSIQFAHLHDALFCNTKLINDATIHLCLTCCAFCRFYGSATACIKFIIGPSFFAAVFSFWRLLEEFAHNSIWRVECCRRIRRLRQRPKAVAMQLLKKKKKRSVWYYVDDTKTIDCDAVPHIYSTAFVFAIHYYATK